MAFGSGYGDSFVIQVRIERERSDASKPWGNPLSVRIEDTSRPYTQVRFNDAYEATFWLAGYIVAAGNGAFSGDPERKRLAYLGPDAEQCREADCGRMDAHGHDETGDVVRAADWVPDEQERVRFPRSVDAEHWESQTNDLYRQLDTAHRAGDIGAASVAAHDLFLACERLLSLTGDGT